MDLVRLGNTTSSDTKEGYFGAKNGFYQEVKHWQQSRNVSEWMRDGLWSQVRAKANSSPRGLRLRRVGVHEITIDLLLQFI
jgi:hypothetical protein